MEELEKRGIHYILPLKRDTPFLKYSTQDAYKDYFIYRDSVRWYIEYEWKRRRVILYMDKKVTADEEITFLKRLREGSVSKEKYKEESKKFEKLALITDLGESAEKINVQKMEKN